MDVLFFDLLIYITNTIAAIPNIKAEIWTIITFEVIKSAIAAPKDAPAETPKVSDDVSGFENRACKEAPATLSPIPHKSAKISRGNLIVNITE